MPTLDPARFGDAGASDGGTRAKAEAQLVARAQGADEAAFEGLFIAHKRKVYSLCLRMTHDACEAEDVTQDIFLQAFRTISTFRGESKFSTWFHRLAVNVVLQRLRRKRRERLWFDDSETIQEAPVHDERGHVDPRLTSYIDRIALRRAIAGLPQGCRIVFFLHDVDGYKHEEIAKIRSCTVGTCKSQLRRARLKLREWLYQYDKRRPMSFSLTARPARSWESASTSAQYSSSINSTNGTGFPKRLPHVSKIELSRNSENGQLTRYGGCSNQK